MEYQGKGNEYFQVEDITQANCDVLNQLKESELSLLWFDDDDNQLNIDSIDHSFGKDQIICLTEFHQLEVVKISQLKFLRFNKPFYCILDHDSEVGCKGALFYGSSDLPILHPDSGDIDVLQTVWKMLCIEMQSQDNLQLEMLQMMLKRMLILCTRIYKRQENYTLLEGPKVDLIREFNYLVELHFREKHSVKAYAELLNRSPKTIANLFNKLGHKSPLQFVQSRIMLEARRLLKYSDRPISEIGYEVGFEDIQAFSRFFKTHEQISPSDFRLQGNMG